MNIIEYLKNKKGSIYKLKYYGSNDFATFYNIKFLLADIEEIKEYAKTISYDINTIDDYINYLFFYIQSQYKNIPEQLNPEIIDDLLKVTDYTDSVIAYFNNASVISFIVNKNLEIQNYQDKEKETYIKRELKELTFELVFKNKNKDLINCGYLDYLINNYIWFAFKNIDKFETMKKSFFKAILSTSNINKLMYNMNDEIVEYIIRLLSNNNYKQFAKEKVEDIYNYYSDSLKNDSVHIYQRHINFKRLLKFLERIGDKRFLEVKKLEDSLNKEQDEELQKNGKTFDYTISSEEYKTKTLENDKLQDVYKLALLTHYSKKIRNKYKTISGIEKMCKKPVTALSDIFTSQEQKDTYYTPAILREYHFYNQYGTIALMCWLNDKYIQNFAQALFQLISSVYVKINYDFDMKDLEKDINYLVWALGDYKEQVNDEFRENYYGFHISSYTCMLIEKILRNIYIAKNPLAPININKINLGQLLNDELTMNKLLGIHTRKYFIYHLSKTDRFVGDDLRNKIMHYNNISISDFKFINAYQNLFLLVLMCNSLFVNIVDFEYTSNN